jgi:hypothetical protein
MPTCWGLASVSPARLPPQSGHFKEYEYAAKERSKNILIWWAPGLFTPALQPPEHPKASPFPPVHTPPPVLPQSQDFLVEQSEMGNLEPIA